MADLKWTSEADSYYKEVHTLKVGNFEIVIHQIDEDNFDLFVNNLDDNGDILWHSLLEGVGSSLRQCKKDSLECMEKLAKDFKVYAKETK